MCIYHPVLLVRGWVGWVRVRARMYLHQVVRLMFLCRVVEGNSFPATDATLSQAQVESYSTYAVSSEAFRMRRPRHEFDAAESTK